MACGLKESGKRFPWVSKPWSVDDETGLPAGFDEVARQVLVVEWCHQSVLAHPAVATFLTHCGWNSSLEVLTAGVPIVALPNFGDQKTNAKFLVDCQRRSDSELMRSLSDRSRKRYVNIAMWKSRTAEAVAGSGSSDRNVMGFVDDIRSRWLVPRRIRIQIAQWTRHELQDHSHGDHGS